MTLGQRIRAAIAALVGKGRRSAGYSAGQLTRFTHSWETDPGAINRVLRFELRTLRARSRQQSRSDGYASKYLRSCVDNIAGADPFRLQAKIRKPRGALDHRANRTLEEHWRRFSQPGGCEITGKLSLAAVHQQCIRTLARDGEILIRMRTGVGPYGLLLQLLDVDRLDEERNETLPGGNTIKMGVEVDPLGRPVAYHLLRSHPGEAGYWGTTQVRESFRVPESEIIHAFISESPEQVRGAPWLSPVLMRMWNIGGFEEAAVLNARVGAGKMGFYISPDGTPPASKGKQKDANGRFIDEAEAGTFEILPAGYDFKTWDPQFPDAAVEPFIRTSLRGIAAGLGVAYHSLANDPSNVNYSTARVALLEERDMWESIQRWYVDHVVKAIYDRWRMMGRLIGALPDDVLSERYDMVQWQCKVWDWVDPQKDNAADLEALGAALTSRTRIAAERGIDIEDVFDELAAEKSLAAEKGVDLALPSKSASSSPEEPPAQDDGNDDEETASQRRLHVVG